MRRRRHLPAERVGHQLHAVADAEHRHAARRTRPVAVRRAGLGDALRPARQDDARPGAAPAISAERRVERQDLGVDRQLAQPARNQLGELRAEIEDDDGLSGARGDAMSVGDRGAIIRCALAAAPPYLVGSSPESADRSTLLPARSLAIALAPPTAAPPLPADRRLVVSQLPRRPPALRCIAGDRSSSPLQSRQSSPRIALSDGAEVCASAEVRAEQPLAADDERVYVAAGEPIHALNAANGRVTWRAPLGATLTAPALAHGGWVVAAAAAS